MPEEIKELLEKEPEVVAEPEPAEPDPKPQEEPSAGPRVALAMDFTEPPKNNNGFNRSLGPPDVMPEISDLEESVQSDEEGGGDDDS